MTTRPTIQRTTAADKNFQILISHLDNELWNELNEDQATYDQYNKVPDISTVLIAYMEQHPVACGCFKEIDENTVEIKRMFVEKQWRGNGISKLVLHELEQWAREQGFKNAILETSIHFNTARHLYQSAGYTIISNYPPYAGLSESVCMKKSLSAV